MYLCNFEIRGTEENVNRIVDAIKNKSESWTMGMDVEDVFQSQNHLVAQITSDCEENLKSVTNALADVKVMAFLEDWQKGKVCLGISDIGSNEFDDITPLFEYDFHGDDRCTYCHYPSESFKETFLFESVGTYGKVNYKCPETDWWEDEDLKPRCVYKYYINDNEITISKYIGKDIDVTIPKEINSIPVTSIGWNAFSGCTGLTSVTIPDSVTSIDDYAFSGCTGLTSVTIPDSVTSIGRNAFYGCTGLTSVTIPDSVTSIGERAFNDTAYYDDTSNWENGNLYIGNILIKVDCNFNGSFELKEDARFIAGGLFSGCTGLTSVTIPDSVTSIDAYAFKGCTGLTSVTIPDSVTSIGLGAFSGCTGLTSVMIPDSVTSIVAFAFDGCTGLTSVTIPDSVTSIGWEAFRGCTGLTSVTIPDSVTSIGGGAFEYCSGLTSVTIPDSVTSIGLGAFDGCTGLTSVTIPNNVIDLGDKAFDFGLINEITWHYNDMKLQGGGWSELLKKVEIQHRDWAAIYLYNKGKKIVNIFEQKNIKKYNKIAAAMITISEEKGKKNITKRAGEFILAHIKDVSADDISHMCELAKKHKLTDIATECEKFLGKK